MCLDTVNTIMVVVLFCIWYFDSVIKKIKIKTGKESKYLLSHPELGSDPLIGSDRESGLDKLVSEHRYTLT